MHPIQRFFFLLLLSAGLTWIQPNSLHSQTGNGWRNLGPYGGTIQGLVADAKNPGVLWAGTATGEIYKTTDNGQNWFYLNTVGKPIRTLLLDTINSNHLYVFARHETDSLSPQVFVSTNGGSAWSSSYSLDFGYVFDAYINPQNTTQLYAISREKIVRSINKGLSWLPIRHGGDSVEFTAMAVNPQDPFRNFFVAYINENNQSVIQRTHDGGYYFETKQILPENWVVTKMFVANDSVSTVLAVLGIDGPAYDSVKIIYSKNNGNNWNTAFAAQIDHRYASTVQNLSSIRWLTFSGPKTYVVSLPDGIYKSNNGGMTWLKLPRNYMPLDYTHFLNRAPNDTTTFFALCIPWVVKFNLGLSGSLGTTLINNGLTAFPVNRILYADEQNIIGYVTDPHNSQNHTILFSQNQGLDYEALESRSRQVTAFWSHVSEQFVWLEENGKVYASDDMRNKYLLDSIFKPGPGVITNAISLNYYFESEGYYSDSTLMIAAGRNGMNNGLWMSVDDGLNWINIYSGVFGGEPIQSISAYPVEIGGVMRIRMIAATDNKIYGMLKGAPGWNLLYSAPPGKKIQQISANFNTVLISATHIIPAIPNLFISRLNPLNLTWEAADITSSIAPLFAVNGPGKIVEVNCAEDGNYLILEHNRPGGPVKRKLYKSSYDPESIRWVEITESPVDLFSFSSVGTNYLFDDNSFNIYASANNGIWTLKQFPIIMHDTLINAPATEVLRGETKFSVNYYNAGSAFAFIDTFLILNDPEGNFSFEDTSDLIYGLFLDIKTATPLEMRFHPKSSGVKQAILEAHLLTRKSVGVGDSIIVLQTLLTGNVTYAQLGSGLKGDTLNMGATLIGSSVTKEMYLRNIGTTALIIHQINIESPEGESPFTLLMDTTQFILLPNEARALPLRFNAGSRDTAVTARLRVMSSSYNAQTKSPDTLRYIILTARASGMKFTLPDYVNINQAFSLEAVVQGMKNSTVSAVLKYWPIGSPHSKLKTRNMTPLPSQDNDLRLVVNIPAEDVTEKGINFYIELTDGFMIRRFPENGDVNPEHLKVLIPSPGLNSSSWQTLPGGTSRKAYRLISFPIDLADKTPQGAFRISNLGELGDQGNWQLYRWDRGLNRFIKASDGTQSFGTINSGKSYLLITRESKTLNSGTGTTVIPGEAQTPILPGWNMIACPYTFPVAWSQIAKNNPKVDFRKIVVLNEGRFEYVRDKDLPSLRLEPWKGYLYYSDTATFVLRYPPIEEGLFAKELCSDDPPRYSLILRLSDKQNEILGEIQLGEHAAANNGYDAFDKPALPVFSNDEIQINLVSEYGKKLYSDFRKISENGSIWDIEIHNLNPDQSVVLAFEFSETLPHDYHIAIFDRSNGRLEFVTPHKLPEIQGIKGKTLSYKVLIGTKDYIEGQALKVIPSESYLAQNYPNPFNPTTTIHYGLSSASQVELTIYNSLGQKVRTLFSGIQNAGHQRIIWNGRNDNGVPVSSGIYIFRATIRPLENGEPFRQSRKMMLIK